VKNKAQKIFESHFGNPTVQVFSPGRANIIGEHTDYNEGYVLPFAIGQGIWFLAAANSTSVMNIIAANTGEIARVDLSDHSYIPVFGWEKYLLQVIRTLDLHGNHGLDLVFFGDLPIGGGVSSSSAITCGFISVLDSLFDLGLTPDDMIRTAVTAEVGSGVRGGIMDQYTIFNGVSDKAILLDCRTGSHKFVDLNMRGYHFYLINTNVRHNLVQTDYNSRRAECDRAVGLISVNHKKISALRDLTLSDLPAIRELLDDTLFNRVSFVVQENDRVLHAVEAIRSHNWNKLGELLYGSHDGLAQMYEVSCDELNWLVNFTLDVDQFLGARMMGGGFGGCTINLTKGKISLDLVRKIEIEYEKAFGLKPEIMPITAENGILGGIE